MAHSIPERKAPASEVDGDVIPDEVNSSDDDGMIYPEESITQGGDVITTNLSGCRCINGEEVPEDVLACGYADDVGAVSEGTDGLAVKNGVYKLFPKETVDRLDRVNCIFIGCAVPDVGKFNPVLRNHFNGGSTLGRKYSLTPNPCDTSMGAVDQTMQDSERTRERMAASNAQLELHQLKNQILHLDKEVVPGVPTLRKAIQGIREPKTNEPIFLSVDRSANEDNTVNLQAKLAHRPAVNSYLHKLGLIVVNKYGERMWECFTESYKNSQLTQYTHDAELDTWMSSADQMNFQARPKNRKKTQVLLQAGDNDNGEMTLKEYFESPTSSHDPICDAKIRPNRAFTQLLNPDEDMSQASTVAGLSNLNSDGSALSGLGDDDNSDKSLSTLESDKEDLLVTELEGFPNHAEGSTKNLPELLLGDQVLKTIQTLGLHPPPDMFTSELTTWFSSECVQASLFQG